MTVSQYAYKNRKAVRTPNELKAAKDKITDDFRRGYKEAMDEHVQILLDYADEARADKRHQAANYLKAAVTKIMQHHGYMPG